MSPARVEFTVKELPAWYRHSFHLSGIATWFTNSGAINSPSDLGWREHSGGCSSLRNIETWVCCFLCRCDPAIENLRSFEHLHPSHTVRNGTTLQKLSKTTSKAEVIRRAKLEGKSSQEFWSGEEVPQVEKPSGIERWFCETRFRKLRCIYGARCFSVTYDGGNCLWTLFQDYQAVLGKQVMPWARTHKSRMKDAPELHLSEEGCPKVWIRSLRARRPTTLGLDWRFVVPEERNF